MKTAIHGIMSLGLLCAAVITADAVLMRMSTLYGWLYLAVCAAAAGVVLATFCTKCPCRENCGHVLPGKIVKRLGDRQPGPYSLAELSATTLSILILLGLPQVWLWRYPSALAVFWALVIGAVIQIRLIVCRACGNAHCPANIFLQQGPS